MLSLLAGVPLQAWLALAAVVGIGWWGISRYRAGRRAAAAEAIAAERAALDRKKEASDRAEAEYRDRGGSVADRVRGRDF